MKTIVPIKWEAKCIYSLAAYGNGAQIRSVLRKFTSAQRSSDPLAQMLHAMLNVLSGGAPGGIRILQRAVARSSEPTRSYALDLLLPLLITSGKVDEAEAYLHGKTEAVSELRNHFVALRGILAACRGHREVSRRFSEEAIAGISASDRAESRACVLQRCSMAAYYRAEYIDAHDLGLEAARLYESCKAFRATAAAYSVPYALAHALFNDADAARSYAALMLRNARRAEDLSLVNYALIALLDIAVDVGDREALIRIRSQLLKQPLPEQYGERASIVIAGVVAAAWSGQFEAGLVALDELRRNERSLARRSLFDALIGLCAAATWDLPEARRRSRLVISQTAEWPVQDYSDTHFRRVARIVAAATCMIIGDATRGRRSLSRIFEKNLSLSGSLSSKGLDENKVPRMLRGYARMINSAAQAAIGSQPAVALTSAELTILRALPDGATLASIAAELGKSPETVKKQVQRIYVKLDISNRVQAVNRARELRLI